MISKNLQINDVINLLLHYMYNLYWHYIILFCTLIFDTFNTFIKLLNTFNKHLNNRPLSNLLSTYIHHFYSIYILYVILYSHLPMHIVLLYAQPYTLHPTSSPYTLHPTNSTLHAPPYTLHPTCSTLHAQPYTLKCLTMIT